MSTKRNRKNDGHILILGAGRAGTTFLVYLLREMGEHTGLDDSNVEIDWSMVEERRAGLEFVVNWWEWSNDRVRGHMKSAPRIIKGPATSHMIKHALTQKLFVKPIDYILLPVRDLEISAKSRFDVGIGITGTNDVNIEANVLAGMIGRTVEAAILFDIPLCIMNFPRLVKNEEYLWECLKPVFPYWRRTNFKKAFKKHAKPSGIKFKERVRKRRS